MDYSLLLYKIEINSETINTFNEFIKTKAYSDFYDRHMFWTNNKGEVFLLTIIDYLQIYNFYKFMETNIKNLITQRPEREDEISCVAPDVYSKRFYSYFERIFDISERERLQSINSRMINFGSGKY
jgi:hypothetical protein